MEEPFDFELAFDREEFFGYFTALVLPEHCKMKRISSRSSVLKLTCRYESVDVK